MPKHHLICSLYEDGYSGRQIAKYVNISNYKVLKILKKNNIKIRDPYTSTLTHNKKKFTFNKSFFFSDSWQLAYMMGFALADGSLEFSKKHNYSKLHFKIDKVDKIILDFFKKISNFTQTPKIYNKNKPNLLCLSYCDPIFKDDKFKSWGLVVNKTYNPGFININSQLIKPFIIGFIDGDGSITFNKKKGYILNIVSNKLTIDQLLKLISNLDPTYIFEWHFEDYPNKIWKRASLTKKIQVLHLINLLTPWNYFYLPRKWQEAINHIKEQHYAD